MVAELPKINLAQTTWGKNNPSAFQPQQPAGINVLSDKAYGQYIDDVASKIGLPTKQEAQKILKGTNEKKGIIGKLKGWGETAWKWATKHKVAAGAIGVGAALLGISAISKNSKEKKAENLSINA